MVGAVALPWPDRAPYKPVFPRLPVSGRHVRPSYVCVTGLEVSPGCFLKDGITSEMVKECLEWAESMGYVETELLHAADYTFYPCKGSACMKCWGYKAPADDPPQCYQHPDDGVNVLMPKTLEADGLLIGFPLHNKGVPSTLKIFQEKDHQISSPLAFTRWAGARRYRVQAVICQSMGFYTGHEVAVSNYDGLKMAFELSAQGKSDREIAMILNTAGYRTTGTHGARPFSRDTVKDMLRNRFYVGYIPNGNSGWVKAKHEPLVKPKLFEEVQIMRSRNRKSTHSHSARGNMIHSLTGITYCWYCREEGREGRMHISCIKGGRPCLGCYNRAKGWGCQQKSASLHVYEEQLRAYIETFSIPEDYQQRILENHKKLQESYDVEREEKQLRAVLRRVVDLYKWGDIDREEYQGEKVRIESELARLKPFEDATDTLKRLADFLTNIAKAWDEAKPEQRNKLARCLFQEIWVKDGEVVAVKPQPEFEPFFRLNWEEFCKVMKSGAKSPSGSHVYYAL